MTSQMFNKSPDRLFSDRRLHLEGHGPEHRLLHCDNIHDIAANKPVPHPDRHPLTCIPWQQIQLSFRLPDPAKIWKR